MFNIFKRNNREETKSSFMKLLDKSGYFEFTDKNHLEELKSKIEENYSSLKIFGVTYYDSGKSTCKKVFLCDAEAVFEDGGFKSQLLYMQNGLERISDFDALIRSVPVSYDYEANPESNWSEGVADFTNRVNSFLEKTSSNYRCYLAYGGNEGSIYILDENQYALLNKEITDVHTRPLDLNNWLSKYLTKETPKINEDAWASKDQLKVGMTINHIKFGVGEILEIDEKQVAVIKFAIGNTRIMLEYAKMKIVE